MHCAGVHESNAVRPAWFATAASGQEHPTSCQPLAWQAALESVDHWPMANLTQDTRGQAAAGSRCCDSVNQWLVSSSCGAHDASEGPPPLVGREIWLCGRTVLWGTQWGQMDSGLRGSLGHHFGVLEPSTLAVRDREWCRAVQCINSALLAGFRGACSSLR